MANLIRVIGIGPGNPEYLTPAAYNLIRTSDLLAGGERVLSYFADLGKATFVIKNNLSELADFIDQNRHDKKIAVLASGDPAFYGIMEFLKRRFSAQELLVMPGISSIQLACARLCISWHDAAFYSVHGRDPEGLAALVKSNPKVIVLTDPANTPAVIARKLLSSGVTGKKFFVCENLSYENETVNEYNIDDVPEETGKTGCVVVITDSVING